MRRTGFDAQATAGAVLDIELQREAGARIAAGIDRCRFEAIRRAIEAAFVIVFRPDHAVRAHEPALAALDAQILPPHRHLVGNIALFPCRRA